MSESATELRQADLASLRRRIALTFALAWFVALGALLALALSEGNARRREALDTELGLRATVIYGLSWFTPEGELHTEVLEREPWAHDPEFPMRVFDARVQPPVIAYGAPIPDTTLEKLRPAIERVVDGQSERWQGSVDGLRVELLPMFADASSRVLGVAMVSHETEALMQELWGYFGALVSAFVLLALLGAWLALRLSAMSVAPLVDLVQSRSRFVARAAHELRTPITTLLSIVDSARAGDEPAARSIERVASVTEAARKRVDTLLWHARLSGGHERARLEPTRLDLLVDQVLEDFPEATPCLEAVEVPIDPALVELAVRNLLENAARHADAAAGAGVEVRVDASGFSVRDRGPGFADVPTSRGLPATRGAAGGVGLGLDIARTVAEMHGGALSWANDPRGGARVTLRLRPETAPKSLSGPS